MEAYALIIFTAAIADNIVLSKMLGLCPLISLSRQLSTAVGVGAATTLVLTIACGGAWLLTHYVISPEWRALEALAFIATVAVVVQAAEMTMRLRFPLLHRRLGIFLPLIATNCAVLGAMLLVLREHPASLTTATAAGFGSGAGFLIAVTLMALIRHRTSDHDAPALFRGAPLAMLTAGFMTLALSALAG